MLAALLILLVMVLCVAALNPSREDFAWFIRLRRPAWLTFEGLIPAIWVGIYLCFYVSALLICRSRSLSNGTLVAFAGWVWGIALTLVLAQQSGPAWLLLIPYLLWSPVGTFVTWQMQRLNR